MLKATEQNDKFKRAITLSIALHCVLIAVLIWSSIHRPKKTSADGGSAIGAIMIDLSSVVQQYNRQQQQTDVQRDKQAQQQVEKLQQRLAAQEVAKAQQRQQAKQQKQAEEAVKQTKAKVGQTAAIVTKKAAEDTKKKAAVEVAKQFSEVNDLLGELTDTKHAPKADGAPGDAGKSKQSGASSAEINAYKAMISRAISNKFYDASSYSGKTCDLRIKLAPDGMLISINAGGGDPALCQAATSAAKLATIPQPPNPQVYEVFKNATLGFSPQ